MSYILAGRNVLITGGSRGLGALCAERFAKAGSNIAINYNASNERAEQVVSTVKGLGVKACAIQADVGKKDDCIRLVQESIQALGGLDIIIANAGWTRFSTFGDIDALPEADWDRMFAINVKSILHVTQAASATFKANPDGGQVLVTASIAGLIPGGSSMAYSVSKAAALHLVRCLATSQGPKIRVNAVSPGLMLTEWGKEFSEEKIEGVRGKSASGKLVTVDEVAEAFLMLARSESTTGANIKMDGGLVP